MGRCRFCQAEITWASTVNQRLMPVDAVASPDGNVRLDNVGGALSATVLGPLERILEADQRPLYMPHFATCPEVEQLRRSGVTPPDAPVDELASRRQARALRSLRTAR